MSSSRPTASRGFFSSTTLLAYLVTFTASFLIMVIELVAGRILAPYVGQHLYSWTSIIGVCLSGISLGAWLGGWLADTFPRRGTLGWILFFSGLFALAIPLLTDTIAGNRMLEHYLTLMWRIVFYCVLIFLPAAVALGMVSPMVIRLVVTDIERTGSVVGRIYAFSTLGSIIGTFATGFYLVEEFGTRLLLYAVGAILVIIAPIVGGLFGRDSGKAGLGTLAVQVLLIVGFCLYRPDLYTTTVTELKKTLGQPVGITEEKVAYWGARFERLRSGQARVDEVYRNGPAAEAGLQVNDVLTSVDSVSLSAKDDEELQKRLEGTPYKQAVPISFKRGGVTQEAKINLTMHKAWRRMYPYKGYDYIHETNYFTLRVSTDPSHYDELTGQNRVLNHLILDNLTHSHSDPDDPTYLAYEYLRIYDELVGWKVKRRGSTKHKQFFIGGGGYTMQRLFHHRYKDCHIDVAEIDPGVTQVAYDYMKAPRDDPRLVTYNQDARLVVYDKYRAGASYDFVFGDAFNDLSIPFHLTTREFDEQVKAMLTNDGLFMALVIDHVGKGHFLPSFLATMRSVFGEDNVVLVLTDEPTFREHLLKYLADNNLKDLIPELQKKKLDDVMPAIRDTLLTAAEKQQLQARLPDLREKSLKEILDALDEKPVDEVLTPSRRRELRGVYDHLEKRKMDDLAPFVKPKELDHITHSTVIVVASRTKQDWKDFDKYLDELNKEQADKIKPDEILTESPKRWTASYVLTPDKVTDYLDSRVRPVTWVDRWFRSVEKGQDVVHWKPIILVDDYAPVDNLTAPMFEMRYGYNKGKVEKRLKEEQDR